MSQEQNPEYRFFGRRKGRPLRGAMLAAFEARYDALSISNEQIKSADSDLKGLFPSSVEQVWLEIGFGGGEHLAWQVQHNPDVGMIGCEPFMNGVASMLRHLSDENACRVRVFSDDARPLLWDLPEGELDRIYILHADPWPKTRHHRRRFIQTDSVARLHQLLRPGGELRLATDDVGYLRWMLARLTAHPGLRWLAGGPSDWKDRPDDWPETRYEAKAKRQGRFCTYLKFQKTD